MIRAVYENPASFPATPAGRAEARAWLAHAYTLAEKDYSTWTRPEHNAGITGLARYFDYGTGPVPEMADDSTYYSDVIRWLVAHPHPGRRSASSSKAPNIPMRAEAARLSRPAATCTPAWCACAPGCGGYRLSAISMSATAPCASPASIPAFASAPSTEPRITTRPSASTACSIATSATCSTSPSCSAKPRCRSAGQRRAKARNAAMHRYLWRAKDGVFADFDFVQHKPRLCLYLLALSAVGRRSHARRSKADGRQAQPFERPGGLSMSNTNTGLQWDEPFGWAPTNWIAVAGLEATGFRDDAQRMRKNWTRP